MNNFIARLGILIVAGLLVSACSSTPQSNHYLLTSRIIEVPDGTDPSLGVGPVVIPGYLNRDTLVYRKSEHQLQITGSERWAEPLEDGISRVVGLNLADLLETGSVQAFPFHPRRKPDFGVKLNLRSLDCTQDSAQLVAEWVLYQPDSGELLVRRLTRLETDLDPQKAIPEQMPAAYSELLWQLSEDIAVEVKAAQ